MNEAEVFVLADRALDGVVAKIADRQWDTPVPPDFARAANDQVPTLREIVNYHAYDDAWVPDMLAGRSMAEAGRDKFRGRPAGSGSEGELRGPGGQGVRGRAGRR